MDKKIGRIVWIIKITMIFFGYLILSMLQHTINPLKFHWIATVLFFLWTFWWLRAKVKHKKGY